MHEDLHGIASAHLAYQSICSMGTKSQIIIKSSAILKSLVGMVTQMQRDADHFLKHLANALSYKWDIAYSVTSSYVSTACFCWCLSCELMFKRVIRRISEKRGLLINIHERVEGGLGLCPSRQRFFIISCAQHYIIS